MNKFLISCLSVLCVLCSCKNATATKTDGDFVINGTVSDNSCDGAQIFLVPLTEEATHETVDSVVIKDGKFSFKGNKARICALRLQMPQRMKFQELLVYTEPGTISAYVAADGSVTGTHNNDLLQEWKTVMQRCASARRSILDGKHTIDSPGVRPKIDSLTQIIGDATFKLVKESGVNPFSRFFYMNNRGTMNDAQIKQLDYMEKDYQHYLDSIRQVAAARKAAEKTK